MQIAASVESSARLSDARLARLFGGREGLALAYMMAKTGSPCTSQEKLGVHEGAVPVGHCAGSGLFAIRCMPLWVVTMHARTHGMLLERLCSSPGIGADSGLLAIRCLPLWSLPWHACTHGMLLERLCSSSGIGGPKQVHASCPGLDSPGNTYGDDSLVLSWPKTVPGLPRLPQSLCLYFALLCRGLASAEPTIAGPCHGATLANLQDPPSPDVAHMVSLSDFTCFYSIRWSSCAVCAVSGLHLACCRGDTLACLKSHLRTSCKPCRSIVSREPHKQPHEQPGPHNVMQAWMVHWEQRAS